MKRSIKNSTLGARLVSNKAYTAKRGTGTLRYNAKHDIARWLLEKGYSRYVRFLKYVSETDHAFALRVEDKSVGFTTHATWIFPSGYHGDTFLQEVCVVIEGEMTKLRNKVKSDSQETCEAGVESVWICTHCLSVMHSQTCDCQIPGTKAYFDRIAD